MFSYSSSYNQLCKDFLHESEFGRFSIISFINDRLIDEQSHCIKNKRRIKQLK
jgi:hypothetical protein